MDKKIKKLCSNKEDLEKLSKEDLINRVLQLESHNNQLRNIIAKSSQTSTSNKYQKDFDFSKAHFRHIFLKLYYLGWDYQGFVTQEDSSATVEHHLFAALIKTCLIKDRESSNYHRCGRTDKGVSAFCQIISIDVRSNYSENEQNDNIDSEIKYCKILNRVLPKEIQCYAWCSVIENMSARFDCTQRTYKYFFPRGNLNIEKMEEASQHLLGTHDFRNFCKMDVGHGVVEFVRNISSVCITPVNTERFSKVSSYDMFIITITGKSFLWHQIRCIMGVLILIGQAREDSTIIKDLLDIQTNPRKPQYSLANEIPLNLFNCSYDMNLNWIVDNELNIYLVSTLQQMWALESVKCTMIRQMLTEFGNLENTVSTQSECLLSGIKAKKYTKLLNRPTCESLEDKIKHFAKRRKVANTMKTSDIK